MSRRLGRIPELVPTPVSHRVLRWFWAGCSDVELIEGAFLHAATLVESRCIVAIHRDGGGCSRCVDFEKRKPKILASGGSLMSLRFAALTHGAVVFCHRPDGLRR